MLAEALITPAIVALGDAVLPFATPDGRPVHCMVLLATPHGELDRHLEMLAALARIVGTDSAAQTELYCCTTSAHAYEILHGEETAEFNYFLGDEDLV